MTGTELGRRLRGAWGVLRHGEPPGPAPEPECTVRRADLVDLVERCFAVVRLPPAWAHDASAQELQALESAVQVAQWVREFEWSDIEAGRWPPDLTRSRGRGEHG